MSHTTHEKQKLINRMRRLRGLMAELVEDHVQFYMAGRDLAQDQRNEGAAELIDVVRAYLK
jgi:FrmR/RcnR family transcriptional regulator, repressor of rcnA expression